MRRGEIWWASLPDPAGSGPGFRRPVAIIQSDEFNKSLIRTTVVAVISSNLKLAAAPGNVLLGKKGTGLKRDSVANVFQLITVDKSQLITVDKSFLTEKTGKLSPKQLQELEQGLRLVLSL